MTLRIADGAPPEGHRPPLRCFTGLLTATWAFAGGLIHLDAAVDHRHVSAVAAGFLVMAAAQVSFASIAALRPTARVLIFGGVLHAAIALVWVVSRATGLPFIPGAEHASDFGVADVVANTFSMAVVGAVIVSHWLPTDLVVSGLLIRRLVTATWCVVLALTLIAVSSAHVHGPAESGPEPIGHDHDHRHP